MDGSDRKFLRSRAFSKGAVGVTLSGNSWQHRFLKEHERICTLAFNNAGIEITEAHCLLITRLGRVALQIETFERRLDKGGISETELRTYANLNHNYLGLMRELVIRSQSARKQSAPSQPAAADDLFASILREVDR